MKDMTSQQNREREFDRLRYLLDVYGGDSKRWPEQELPGLTDLLEHDAEAQRLVDHARMLDLMIEGCELKAPSLPPRDLALLSNRIVAQARADKQQTQIQSSPRYVKATPAVLRPTRSQMWRAATLMAACLVVGIMVGRSGLLLSPTAQVTEVSSYDETLTGLSADDELTFFVGEDII